MDTPERADYEGVWPAVHYYDPDSKSPAERKELLEWYETVKGEVSFLSFSSKIYLLALFRYSICASSDSCTVIMT